MKASINSVPLKYLLEAGKQDFEKAANNSGYLRVTVLLVKMIFNSLQVDEEGNFQAVYDSLWLNDEYECDELSKERESVYYLETTIFIKFKDGKFYGDFAGVSEPISKEEGDKKYNN